MCIYCNTTNYRKIYENHNGPIPLDESGRTYEVHHVDGDHSNNDPSNLLAVSIEEHLNIHLIQQDWAAAAAIMNRLAQSPSERSEFMRSINIKRVEDGTHQFLGERNPSHKRVADGTHHFIGGQIAKRAAADRIRSGSHNFQGSANNNKRIEQNRHPFVGGSIQRERMLAGTHQNQTCRVCPHCGKQGKGPTMFRYHFDRCKAKP
jgi:hypothetical protein